MDAKELFAKLYASSSDALVKFQSTALSPNKEKKLKNLIENLKLDLEKLIIIAIGDGNSDLDLFLWGLVYGIAYTTDKQELIDAAKQQAANASEMLKIIKERLEQ